MHNPSQRAQAWQIDEPTQGVGSYNAIRVYLWLGMMAPDDPDRAALLPIGRGMIHALKEWNMLPESMSTQQPADRRIPPGQRPRQAPLGFYAAMLPYLDAAGEPGQKNLVAQHLESQWQDADQGYYGHVLRLFALGFEQQRYRFDRQGRLHTRHRTMPCG